MNLTLRTVVCALVVPACGCTNASFPTAAVVRADYVESIQVQGEIKAARSLTLRAPADAGELRIIALVPNGTTVTVGTVVAEFDASTVARTLDEKRTEVNATRAEIDKARAEATTREAETMAMETTARFDVERAKLDYSGRDALSRVEAEQRRLKILDAEQKLREATAKLESVRAESRAQLAAVTQKARKAQRDLDEARTQLGALRITAPASGILNLLPNSTNPFSGQQVFKPGDRVWPGAEIAELPDPSSLYVMSRADELERGRLELAQTATVRVEGLPDRELRARVQAISPLAKSNFTSWPPPRNFDLTFALEEGDKRLRPGMTATVRVAVERLRDVLQVPAAAVFDSRGEEVVYVLVDGKPERRKIEADRRNAERVVVRRGVSAGEHVTLLDPERARGSTP